MTTPAKKRSARARQVRDSFTWDDDAPLKASGAETTKANQALFDYAQMGVARSLTRLIAMYERQEKQWTEFNRNPKDWVANNKDKPIPVPIPSKSWTVISEWSMKFHWKERVAQFDEKERERLQLEFQVERSQVSQQRKTLAKAFFGKTVQAVQQLVPQGANFHETTRAVVASLEQLREEYGADTGAGSGGGDIKVLTVILAPDDDVKVKVKRKPKPEDEDDDD